MQADLFHVQRGNLESKKVELLVKCLENGGIALVPTDSLYSLVAVVNKPAALEKICKLKNIRPEKELFSLFCRDLASAAEFTAQIERSVFKVIKKNTPGPFTFILRASNSINKVLKNRKETVGIRIPRHPLWEAILHQLSVPIIGSSAPGQELVFDEDDHQSWVETFHNRVDLIWDEGFYYAQPSAILDCVFPNLEVIREGPEPIKW